MNTPSERESLLESIAELATSRELAVAAAESLTGGQIAESLASVPESAGWFSGSVVVFRDEAKRNALGVTAEEVVSAECAEQMASGALKLFGCDVAVSTTGVGGPNTQEDKEPGTVYIGVCGPGGVQSFSYDFDGEPAEILESTVVEALRRLEIALRDR